MESNHLGRLLFELALLGAAIFLVLLVGVFIRNLLRPAVKAAEPLVEAVAPVIDRFEQHVDASLRKSGLAPVADAGQWVKSTSRLLARGAVRALDAVEKRTDRRPPPP